MISNHLFTQLPPPKAALLVLPILSAMAASHVLPRETNSFEAQVPLNVVSWPILATQAPLLPNQLLRRRSNTVCGYIGGDPNLPATCLAGSHCAADVEHGAIGCCPDDGSCKGGIFTGCVDRNSGPQTMADPYIFTCRGRNVCYKNQFEGGFFQYGCGTASDLATTVVPSASGMAALRLTTISVQLTATPTPLSRPTSLSSESTETSGTGSISSTSSSTDSGLPAVSDGPPPSTTDSAAAPSSDGSNPKNTGAIIGGAVGGVAFIFALVTLGFFLWRRKSKRNLRSSADAQDPKHMRSMAPDHDHFEPYTSRQQVSEIRLPADIAPINRNSDGASMESGVLGSVLPQPHQLGDVEDVVSRNGGASGESDRVPLNRELDEFSHGFNAALERIEPDSDAETQHSESYPGPRRGGGGGVLWQQNRRRNRNLV